MQLKIFCEKPVSMASNYPTHLKTKLSSVILIQEGNKISESYKNSKHLRHIQMKLITALSQAKEWRPLKTLFHECQGRNHIVTNFLGCCLNQCNTTPVTSSHDPNLLPISTFV
jgi:hypothetical protein